MQPESEKLHRESKSSRDIHVLACTETNRPTHSTHIPMHRETQNSDFGEDGDGSHRRTNKCLLRQQVLRRACALFYPKPWALGIIPANGRISWQGMPGVLILLAKWRSVAIKMHFVFSTTISLVLQFARNTHIRFVFRLHRQWNWTGISTSSEEWFKLMVVKRHGSCFILRVTVWRKRNSCFIGKDVGGFVGLLQKVNNTCILYCDVMIRVSVIISDNSFRQNFFEIP